MKLRKTTSLTTLLSFILLVCTSAILYISPQGKIAFWADWKILGMGKEEWGALHTNLGILFLVAGILHTLLNWKPIVNYLKNKAQQIKVFTADFNIALILTLFIVLSTILGLPPISGIQHFSEKLKTDAAERYGEPPYGHAEVSPLKSFCKNTGIDLQDAIKQLDAAGLQAVSEGTTLAEIANANHMTPQAVYTIIKPEPPKAGETVEMPLSPGMGFGRKALAGICAQYGLDEEKIISGLKEYGIQAAPETSMKEIAENADMDPHALYDVIRQMQ